MMKRVFTILAIMFLALSCTKEDRNNTIVNQEESIDRYISSLDGVRVIRNGGSNRIVYTEGTGADSLAVGDSVKFYYAGYVFSNGKGSLFATNNPQIAQEKDFPLSGDLEERILNGGNFISGLANGLAGVKAGEKYTGNQNHRSNTEQLYHCNSPHRFFVFDKIIHQLGKKHNRNADFLTFCTKQQAQ
jgi:hypothetical protein